MGVWRRRERVDGMQGWGGVFRGVLICTGGFWKAGAWGKCWWKAVWEGFPDFRGERVLRLCICCFSYLFLGVEVAVGWWWFRGGIVGGWAAAGVSGFVAVWNMGILKRCSRMTARWGTGVCDRVIGLLGERAYRGRWRVGWDLSFTNGGFFPQKRRWCWGGRLARITQRCDWTIPVRLGCG